MRYIFSFCLILLPSLIIAGHIEWLANLPFSYEEITHVSKLAHAALKTAEPDESSSSNHPWIVLAGCKSVIGKLLWGFETTDDNFRPLMQFLLRQNGPPPEKDLLLIQSPKSAFEQLENVKLESEKILEARMRYFGHEVFTHIVKSFLEKYGAVEHMPKEFHPLILAFFVEATRNDELGAANLLGLSSAEEIRTLVREALLCNDPERDIDATHPWAKLALHKDALLKIFLFAKLDEQRLGNLITFLRPENDEFLLRLCMLFIKKDGNEGDFDYIKNKITLIGPEIFLSLFLQCKNVENSMNIFCIFAVASGINSSFFSNFFIALSEIFFEDIDEGKIKKLMKFLYLQNIIDDLLTSVGSTVSPHSRSALWAILVKRDDRSIIILNWLHETLNMMSKRLASKPIVSFAPVIDKIKIDLLFRNLSTGRGGADFDLGLLIYSSVVLMTGEFSDAVAAHLRKQIESLLAREPSVDNRKNFSRGTQILLSKKEIYEKFLAEGELFHVIRRQLVKYEPASYMAIFTRLYTPANNYQVGSDELLKLLYDVYYDCFARVLGESGVDRAIALRELSSVSDLLLFFKDLGENIDFNVLRNMVATAFTQTIINDEGLTLSINTRGFLLDIVRGPDEEALMEQINRLDKRALDALFKSYHEKIRHLTVSSIKEEHYFRLLEAINLGVEDLNTLDTDGSPLWFSLFVDSMPGKDGRPLILHAPKILTQAILKRVKDVFQKNGKGEDIFMLMFKGRIQNSLTLQKHYKDLFNELEERKIDSVAAADLLGPLFLGEDCLIHIIKQNSKTVLRNRSKCYFKMVQEFLQEMNLDKSLDAALELIERGETVKTVVRVKNSRSRLSGLETPESKKKKLEKGGEDPDL